MIPRTLNPTVATAALIFLLVAWTPMTIANSSQDHRDERFVEAALSAAAPIFFQHGISLENMAPNCAKVLQPQGDPVPGAIFDYYVAFDVWENENDPDGVWSGPNVWFTTQWTQQPLGAWVVLRSPCNP